MKMFFWKSLKRVSFTRLWKCKRKSSLKQFVIITAMVGIFSCLISVIVYYLNKKTNDKHQDLAVSPKVQIESTTTARTTRAFERKVIVRPMVHIPLDEIYPDAKKEDVDSFEFVQKPTPMIDTNGCRIPISMIPYNRTRQKLSCGLRAVFLKKVGDNKIQATIKIRVIKKYLRINGTFHCCYKFFTNPIKLKDGSRKTLYTNCKVLNESVPILLKSEFVTVKCFQNDNNTTYVIYKDAYAFVKKIATPQPSGSNCKHKYNVLIIGMDSMSLSRFEQTMRRSTKCLKDNYWLGYRAFNKVEADAFPNLVAALTGMDMTQFLSQKCENNMTKCRDLFIWSKFKEIGYVTAYGEDYTKQPGIFSNSYKFYKRPTDHYPSAFFVNEEHLVNNTLVCAGKQSSGEHILNYALDFAVTYRSKSFFGLFWIHSFSQSLKSPLVDVDKKVENFLYQLSYTGVLMNTFVILMSAHGILVGDSRLNSNSFYDERMPILFMLPALKFQGHNPEMFNSAIKNQARLVTPYDLHNTFVKIKQISSCVNSTVSKSCPKCQSLLETISTNRTCPDAGIHEKWCTCRNLIEAQNDYGVKSILHVVAYIQSMIKSIKTRECWTCSSLSLKKIIRMHFYYDETKINLFHVVAFLMTPGDLVYEATVAQKERGFEVVGPVSLLSDIESIGNCTLYQYTRSYCLCVKQKHC